MRGAITPLPNTPSCRGAYLSIGTTLPLSPTTGNIITIVITPSSYAIGQPKVRIKLIRELLRL
jgi:hypothetical protein